VIKIDILAELDLTGSRSSAELRVADGRVAGI
jgi:hypothetical protein